MGLCSGGFTVLLEGFLRLTFGGLIFGRAYFFVGGGELIIGILRYNIIYEKH